MSSELIERLHGAAEKRPFTPKDETFVERIATTYHSIDGDDEVAAWSKQPSKYRGSVRKKVRQMLDAMNQCGLAVVSKKDLREAADALEGGVTKLHGPFGHLNGHRALSEDSWTIEDDPLANDEEYFSIPLYALTDPFAEIGKDGPLSAPAQRVEEGCHECGGKTFAAVDERKSDGSFAPGPLKRCVECKTVAASPAPAPHAGVDAEEMTLRVALDFADNPRPYHSLQAPADTNGELYKALSVLAEAYRAALEDRT